MARRVLCGGWFQETNTFVDSVTRWADFRVDRGPEILRKLGDASVMDGFLEEAVRQGWTLVPTVDAWAVPGGAVEDGAFEAFWKEFSATTTVALADGLDAIFLVLHGAMVTTRHSDPEGELLRRIRELPGAATIPIFGVLDLHANVTRAMCRFANALVMYRENPHTDAKAAGTRAATLIARMFREGKCPHMAWCRLPMIWPPLATGTADNPMKAMEAFAREVERQQEDIWEYTVAAGFSFADIAETGVSLSVISVGEPALDREVLTAGAMLAWERRADVRLRYLDLDAVLTDLAAKGLPPGEGPILLVEPADNIGAGAPGDCTSVLRALLRHRIQRGLVAIHDPAAVAALADARLGEQRTLSIGGRGSRLDPGPVECEATLVSRSDGRFELADKQSHLAAMSGARFDMGPCAVVRCAGVTVLLTSRRTPPMDLGQWLSQGIEPQRFAFIGVKAAVAHRRAYDPIARASYYVETPGPCACDLSQLPWKNVQRPVWPLDPVDVPACDFS